MRRDLQREVVFPFERAERAGHSAATGVEQGCGSARQTRGEPRHESGFDERFRVAMRVDRDVAGYFLECKRVGFALEKVFDELLEEMTALRDRLGIRQLQFAIVLDEH